jgi:hypothetical protein
MRLLLVAAFALITSPAAAVAVQTLKQPLNPLEGSARCPRTTSVYAWDRSKAVRPQKLTELPDANAYSAVLRHIGRCEVPVVVRYGIGGGR